MKKAITSLILTFSVCFNMMIPAFGLSSQTESENTHFDPADTLCEIEDIETDLNPTIPVDQIQSLGQYDAHNRTLITEVNDWIARQSPDLVSDADIDFSRLYASTKQHIPASLGRSNINENESVRNPMSTAWVYNESDLAAALANPSIINIIVMASFSLSYTHSINRTLYFMTSNNNTFFAITAASGLNHFSIQNQSSSITVSFDNVTLDGNYVGGGIVIQNSYVTLIGADIQYCKYNGSCTGSAVTADNLALNPVTNKIQASGSLSIIGCNFSYNQTDGGAAVECSGPISISSSQIMNNIGCGVSALNLDENGSTAVFHSVYISSNTSSSSGGGLALCGYYVIIDGTSSNQSMILSNTAQRSGGGVFCYMCDTEIEHTELKYNTIVFEELNERSTDPTAIGGAGIMNVGSLSITYSCVQSNDGICDFGYGVGVYALNPATVLNNYDPDDYPWLSEAFTVTNSTVSGNGCAWGTGADPYERSMNGGGIASIGLKIQVTDTTIAGNTALIGGGAFVIYEYNEDDLEPFEDPAIYFLGTTVQNNEGKYTGGGIALIGPSIDDDDVLPATVNCEVRIEDSIAQQSAVTGNTSCYGAGIMVFGAELTIAGGTLVQGNVADSSSYTAAAGDIFPQWDCAGGGVLIIQHSKLYLPNGQILSNTTLKTTSQQSAGAGIYVMGTSEAYITGAQSKVNANGTDVQVDTNRTGNTTEGGGIYTEKDVSLYIRNGEIKNNKAKNGAGIASRGNLIISGGTISNNTADTNGGGILARDTVPHSVNVTISGGLISGNNAGNGAGIRSGAPIIMTGGTIHNNSAYAFGGGIYTSAMLTITAGTISGNQAAYNGGGILLIKSASIGTNNGSNASVLIQENTAGRDGGGISATGGATTTLTLYSGTIAGNTATRNGGGIYASEVLNIAGGVITGNYADNGGGLYNVLATTMSGGSVTLNTATYGDGGGIYAANAMTMSGGVIASNTADDGNGGGIYAANSVTMSGGEIKLNTAPYGNGGGIFKAANGIMTMTGGIIGDINGSGGAINEDENQANCGAGVYIEGSACLSGGEIVGNYAISYGGGLYITSTGCVLNTGCLIHDNNAGIDGGGIYIELGGCYQEDDDYVYHNFPNDISGPGAH